MKQVYTVRVKDGQQDITHTLHEWASSQNIANSNALAYLRKALRHTDFEIVEKIKKTKKPRSKVTYTSYANPVKAKEVIFSSSDNLTEKWDAKAWRKRSQDSISRISERSLSV